VTAINGSGAAPAAATPARFKARGHATIPPRGVLPISTCGLVHAWQACLHAFGSGRQTFTDLLERAANLAQQGGEVDLYLQNYLASDDYRQRTAASPELARIFGPCGVRPLGTRLPQPALARTLRRLAVHGVDTLYGGALGAELIADLAAQGALLSLDDLRGHDTRFEAAPSVRFHGRQLHFAPPNSQGLALGLLAGLWDVLRHAPEAAQGLEPALYMRIKRLAFKYRDRHAVDPARGNTCPADLFSPERLAAMLQSETAPLDFEARAGGGDTSTLVVVDRWGNAVSWVQSLFEDFGSGVVSPATGIVMHNRLYLESLDGDPWRGLQPGMRPFHTLCPALLVGEHCEMAIATPGDHGQPQSIFQVLVNAYDRGMNIQAAIEAPRMRHDSGRDFLLETRADPAWRALVEAQALDCRAVGPWSRLMGGVNAIQRTEAGVMLSGADPRRSCYAVCA
jgi:gamma-glutamyltranspeptidase/glutathione hydrolase